MQAAHRTERHVRVAAEAGGVQITGVAHNVNTGPTGGVERHCVYVWRAQLRVIHRDTVKQYVQGACVPGLVHRPVGDEFTVVEDNRVAGVKSDARSRTAEAGLDALIFGGHDGAVARLGDGLSRSI